MVAAIFSASVAGLREQVAHLLLGGGELGVVLAKGLLGLEARGLGVGDVLADAILARLQTAQHVLPGGFVENDDDEEEDAQDPQGRS